MKINNNFLQLKGDNYFPKNKIPIQVFSYLQNTTILHSHDFAEIAVIIKGSGIHSNIKQQITIGSADVLLIPPGVVHSYSKVDNLELVNIIFSPKMIIQFLPELRVISIFKLIFLEHYSRPYIPRMNDHLKFNVNNFKTAKQLLNLMILENTNITQSINYCLGGYFLALMAKLSKFCKTNDNKYMTKEIEDVINYIHNNFEKYISFSKMVKISGMSKSTFLRYFNGATKSTPVKYLNELRLSQACILLHQTDLKVSKIAYEVGFNDSNYFSNVFCKYIKISPRQYRKNEAFIRFIDKKKCSNTA